MIQPFACGQFASTEAPSRITSLPPAPNKSSIRLRSSLLAIRVFLPQASRIGNWRFRSSRESLITLSSYVTQCDSRSLAEPERFDPERFLPDRADEIPSGAYFPVGGGPRVCIGQSFAMTEMVLIAATMLQQCEVQNIPGATTPTPHVTMALRPKEPLTLRWRRRSTSLGVLPCMGRRNGV